MKGDEFAVLVLLPIFTLTIVFLTAPLFYGLGTSLFDLNPVRGQNSLVGFKNHQEMSDDAVFLKAVRNTLIFVLVTVASSIVFTPWVSTTLVDLPWKRQRSFFRAMSSIPCIAPLVTSAVVWNEDVLTIQGDLLSSLLRYPGIAPISWLGDQNIVMAVIILSTLWADSGCNTVFFCAGLEGTPRDFLETADVDGAGPLCKLMSIRLPLLRCTFIFVLMMIIIFCFQMITRFVVLVAKGGVSNSTTILAYYTYKSGFIDKNMGYAPVVATILFVLIFTAPMVQRRLSRADWEY